MKKTIGMLLVAALLCFAGTSFAAGKGCCAKSPCSCAQGACCQKAACTCAQGGSCAGCACCKK